MKNTIKQLLLNCTLILTVLVPTTIFAHTTQQNPPVLNTTTTDFTVQDANGNKIKMSALQGKAVFVNFWATWCPPCIKEMPSIEALKNKLKGEDIVFVMVDVDGDHDKAQRFMDKKKYKLPVYIPVSSVSPNYLGNAVPTTLIFDKKGNMVQRIVGGVDYDSKKVEEFMRYVINM
ncbi:TlpA family protein disulfide reductase [Myroides pelagicus]|uniref:Redoxin domain-containing protein n=1 Tax=Myroides pelagicus TaxID=270914 RepID=A0A7K1GLZ6_9FLAO|nr:TlpA disulfide reductase family protein [Myroides pelagicus]MEC4114313.1 TlpA disulfide reductase family protein [Myroides pelagicus]MTH29841.1 redoxin domain-containing protein [Myroides pelagicus]